MATKKKAASTTKAARAKATSGTKKINLLAQGDVSVPTSRIKRLADAYAKRATTSDSVQLSGVLGFAGGALAATTGVVVGGTVTMLTATAIVALALTEERASGQACIARETGTWLRSWFVSDKSTKA